MQLIVQPDDGITPVVQAIDAAERSIEVVIFRLDVHAVTRALERAVRRGVAVHALIAHANSDGTHVLRQLEGRLLTAGAAVSRTADRLLRYHGKMMIVDAHTVHIYAFNFTRLDCRSRSMGISCSEPRLVHAARELFHCDASHATFEPTCENLVISPENARAQLAEFIERAEQRLAIYDPRLTDPKMLRLLEARASAGVDVRIIGETHERTSLTTALYAQGRMHLRAIVRDDLAAFVGSQSLRNTELDKRREIGVTVHDAKTVRGIVDVFERDWAAATRVWNGPTATDVSTAPGA